MELQATKRFLTEMVSSKKISGCAAAVFRGGNLCFCDYAGTTNGTTPVGRESAFRLASMTKPVTAVAVLLCVQDGLLNLEDNLKDILPAFTTLFVAKKTEHGFVKGERAEDVKICHLLTHSSGIGSGEASDKRYPEICPREGDTLASAVNRYAECLLDFQPGSAQLYSAVLGFDVLARVVEKATGTPYGEFLQKRIFGPLGMKKTSYLLEDYKRENLALAYKSEDGVLTPLKLESNFETFPAGYTGGGAGLLSTLPDYCRFAEMLRRAYAGGDEIISTELVREMGKPQLDESKIEGVYDFFNWGYGVRTVRAQKEFQPLPSGSFGWSGAYGSHFWIDPENGVTAVYLHNSATYGGAGAPHTIDFERAVITDLKL